jgi:D-alanyl-D-alanine dipeptidase
MTQGYRIQFLLLFSAGVLGCGCDPSSNSVPVADTGTNTQQSPPVESGDQEMPKDPMATRSSDLVELAALEPTLKLDIRYAGTNNFLNRPVYKQARAFLQRPAAEALVQAHTTLKAQGYGIVIYDGYRPWSVTVDFWESVPPHLRRFVAPPELGSRHNRGCAVDCALYDLATGEPVVMPTDYDEMSARAHIDSQEGSVDARNAREQLRAAMEAHGFQVLPHEWWHFDHVTWREYPILNISFESLP